MSATTILSPSPSRSAAAKTAVIHRMVMPHHTCPYGLKAKDLLERSGYEVEDHHLATREHGKGKHPAIQLLKARILLKADVSEAGEGWSDSRIVEAWTRPSLPLMRTARYHCRRP